MDLFSEICKGCYNTVDLVFIGLVILLFSPVIVVVAFFAFPILAIIGAIKTFRETREEEGSN